MHIKGRFKLIRKYDCDFWNLMYYKNKRNRFFNYYRYSLVWRIRQKTFAKDVSFHRGRYPKIGNLGMQRISKSMHNPFYADENIYDIVTFTKAQYRRFFKNRRFRHVSFVYRRGFFRKSKASYDLLLGAKSAFQLYRPFRYSEFTIKRHFFRQLILFYNDFDFIKLKRFGRLGRRGQCGGINHFFFLLESRIDSIILRLNIAGKFVLREVIRARRVLVDGIPISYANYIVKQGSFITFREDLIESVYSSLLDKISNKIFFVQPPFYMEINYRTLIILIVPRLIDPSYVPYPFLRTKSSVVAGLHTILWGW